MLDQEFQQRGGAAHVDIDIMLGLVERLSDANRGGTVDHQLAASQDLGEQRAIANVAHDQVGGPG